MVRPTSAISEDVLHVRTTDVWMGVVSAKSPNGVKRGGFLGLLLALFGPHATSDLSPECAPKRTSADHSEFMGSRPGQSAGARWPNTIRVRSTARDVPANA
jgi:hypothetical protein